MWKTNCHNPISSEYSNMENSGHESERALTFTNEQMSRFSPPQHTILSNVFIHAGLQDGCRVRGIVLLFPLGTGRPQPRLMVDWAQDSWHLTFEKWLTITFLLTSHFCQLPRCATMLYYSDVNSTAACLFFFFLYYLKCPNYSKSKSNMLVL